MWYVPVISADVPCTTARTTFRSVQDGDGNGDEDEDEDGDGGERERESEIHRQSLVKNT